MNKLLVSAVILMGSITMGWSQASNPDTHTWILKLTPQSSKYYLDSVMTAWSANNIALKFSKLQYIKNGTLLKVEGSVVVTANGHNASATFKSDKLELWEIKVTDKPSVSVKGK